MINRILMRLRPVESGFDPVGEQYAQTYAEHEWRTFNPEVVDSLESWLGGFEGKRVLDLGGGPGQYSAAFAQRGAEVVWHDISMNYCRIAKAKSEALGLKIDFSLGYMEEAIKFADRPFDFVFNRICWYYCINDDEFAQMIFSLVCPSGHAYIDNYINKGSGAGRIRYWINALTGWKIGNPPPPPGRLEMLFRRFEGLQVDVLHRPPTNERLFLTRVNHQ